MCSRKTSWPWALLLVLLLSLFVARAHGQDTEPVEAVDLSSPQPALPLESTLSSLTQSELWLLFEATLQNLKEQSAQDRLRYASFEQSMLESLDSLEMQALASQRSERRIGLALTRATQALTSSTQSAQSLSDETQTALDLARRRLIEARIAEIALILALGGLGALVIF